MFSNLDSLRTPRRASSILASPASTTSDSLTRSFTGSSTSIMMTGAEGGCGPATVKPARAGSPPPRAGTHLARTLSPTPPHSRTSRSRRSLFRESRSSGLRGGNELSREAKFRALEIARARLLLRWRSMNEERMPTPLVRSQCVLFRLPCILQSTMYIITSPGLFPLGYPDREPRPVSSGTPAREPKPGRPRGLWTRRHRQRRCQCRWPPGSGPEP